MGRKPTPERFDVEFTGEVVVTVTDPAVFDRVNETEWSRNFYGINTKTAMVRHLVWNCIANGYGDASRLDGFADIDEGVVTMEIDRQMLDVVEVS